MLEILATQKVEIRRTAVPSQPWETVRETLSRKYPTNKKRWLSGQVVEGLFSRCEVLSSPKKKKKKNQS
jgi:hypothetical protein